MSEAKSEHDYNLKTEFQIGKDNKEFERENILMSQRPLDSTPIGRNTTNEKYHIWNQLLLVRKHQTPSHLHEQQNRQNTKKKREKSTY